VEVNPVKVIYAGLHNDYGLPERGPSFEYQNLYRALDGMRGEGVEAVEFPMDLRIAELGIAGANRTLVDLVRAERPAALFVVLFKDEIGGEALREIAAQGVVTIAWFSDDHWRGDTYGRRQAPLYSWVVTTDSRGPDRYRRMGRPNVIRSQWACNTVTYGPRDRGRAHEVTFVGQPHGTRPGIVRELAARRIPVECWGLGWPAGRIDQDEMIRVFSRSRINLNLTNSSGRPDFRSLVRCVVERRPDRSLRLRWPSEARDLLLEMWGRRREQIKGRHFEIPGCGGFQLSGSADDLERYFTPGKEIAIARDTREMGDMIRYYLDHEEERSRVAEAGYRRTLAEHTYAHRFREIFRTTGVMPR